jgi:hypothetical protein
MSSTTSAALLEVGNFDRRSSATSWKNIPKRNVTSGLRTRLQDPNLISSRVVNLCGPAAFFRCLVEDDPAMYARAVISLFETNSATLGARTFKAGADLQTAMPASGMDAVDWITMPAGLAKWFGNAKYTGVINETNLIRTKDLAHLQRAGSLRAAGYRVCLLINSQVLSAATQGSWSMFPNHWVVLLNNVSVDGSKNVSLQVQTWGVVKNVPGAGTLAAGHFCRNYYGFVAARPSA